jgi:uncharacterized DUF497 family protein
MRVILRSHRVLVNEPNQSRGDRIRDRRLSDYRRGCRERIETSRAFALASVVYTSVYLHVRFSWDPRKSEANLGARGFDFEFASLIFEGLTLERADDRKDYGETRVLAIGLAEGVYLTVAYTDRHAPDREIERRIISARRSNSRERKAYNEAVAKG